MNKMKFLRNEIRDGIEGGVFEKDGREIFMETTPSEKRTLDLIQGTTPEGYESVCIGASKGCCGAKDPEVFWDICINRYLSDGGIKKND